MDEIVRLCDLVSQSHLNGKVGVIVQHPTDTQPRYAIKVEGKSAPLLVKGKNLVKLPPAESSHILPIYFGDIRDDRAGVDAALRIAREANSRIGTETIEMILEMRETTKQQWRDTCMLGILTVIKKMDELDVAALDAGAVPEP